MNLFFQILIAAVLASFGATTFAQCIPMNAPGPPRLWDPLGQCYVPQGTPQAGQTLVVPAGVQVLQPATAVAGGLNGCQTLGAITGGTLGSFAHNHRAQAIVLGLIGGGLVGNAICTSNQGERVLVVQQPQGAVVQPGNTWQQPSPCAHDPGTAQGVLNLPGHPKNGQTVCARPGDPNISRWL